VLFRLRDFVVSRLTGERLARLETGDRELGAVRARLSAAAAAPSPAAGDVAAPIEAREIFVRFGGNAAVDDVSLIAHPGEIVGLMGPNGAGKTTLFDVLSGHLRPDHGVVLLEGDDVTRLRPEQRARRGLGRTFQQARLFDDLSLVEALEVAFECREPSEAVPSLLGLPPSRDAERRKADQAQELIELLGLGPYAERSVAELSTGTRRVAELAAVIGMGSRVVLLDEPTAGIAQREVEAFRPVLREVRDHLGATMIVIEHDLPLLLDVVDRLYVLVAGRIIAEGDPRALREDPAVIAAYLGTDERVVARSGRRRAKAKVKAAG
jgi:ABC-type branched-subunit amino acid transport system ATPase component